MENLEILFEDNHIIVVFKPQNVPSCEDESRDEDLLSATKKYIKEEYNKQGNVFLGLVHRLDRPTGGIMVFAKTSKAAARLSEGLKQGDFEKKYFEVVVGEPKQKSQVLVNYLKKNAINNTVYVCSESEEGAKRAELFYKVVKSKDNLSLLDIELNTGRSHQIRVQTSAMGYPVYGDMRYGGKNAVKGKLSLWAYSLSFTHPVTKERMRFLAEPPIEEYPWSLFDTADFFKMDKPEL